MLSVSLARLLVASMPLPLQSLLRTVSVTIANVCHILMCLFASVPTGSPQNITTDSDVEYVDIIFEVI